MKSVGKSKTSKKKVEIEENMENSPREFLTISRRGSDMIFMCALIFIAIYQITIVAQFPAILEALKLIGCPFDVSILLWLVPGIAFSYILYFPVGDFLSRFWIKYMRDQRSRENETTEERIERCKSYLMGFFYYALSFIATAFVAINTDLLPKVYGGNLNLVKFHESWPSNIDNSIKAIYMLSLGHHVERFFVHMVVNYKTATYFTMFLHHIITVGLIAISMFTHYYHFGIPVLLLLDLSDALLQLSRFLRETIFQISSKVAFVLMFVAWVQGRVYGFIVEILWHIMIDILLKQKHEFMWRFFGLHLFFFTSLMILGILNVFWLYQILKIFLAIFINKSEKLEYEDKHMKKKTG